MTYFLKVELLIRVLVGPCGNCAPTIEAQKKSDEPRCGPIFVIGLEGPATFVLVHPLIRVGWADPSLETPNCLFAVAVSVSLLYPSYNSYTLVSLFTFALLLLFGFNLGLSTPWRSSQGLLQITPNCVKWVFCWIPHPFPTMLFIANLTQLLYSRVESDFCRIGHVKTAPCSLQQQGLSSKTHSSFPLKRELV